MFLRCPHCNGTGRVTVYVFTNLDGQRIYLPVSCRQCDGTGVKRKRRGRVTNLRR